MDVGGPVIDIRHHRYMKLYREQIALWLSRGLGLKKSAEMQSLNARLREEPPPAIPYPLSLEEAS